jgi:CrcB protein
LGGKRVTKYLIIGLGGFLGANCRYFVGELIAARFGAHFPYGTLIINISGSFAIGLFLALAAERFIALQSLRFLLVIGFLGAYTTFSAFSFESLALIQSKAYLAAALNLAGSVVLGIIAVTAGVAAARLL